VVADDVALDRCALSHLISSWPECRVVAETSNGTETADACRQLSPDVVVMSIALPTDAANPVLQLRTEVPGQRVLAVSERPRRACGSVLAIERARSTGRFDSTATATLGDCLDLAANCGAEGTLRRDAAPERLREALSTIAHGEGFHEFDNSRAPRPSRRALSPRESEVAQLLGEGRSNKEIAQRLDVSEPTVKKHIGHLLRKLGLQDRLQVALFVSRHPEYVNEQLVSVD
jgi:DNA-binding NarL/FixJ family response regulator